MPYAQVTYHELLTHANKLGVQVIPWDQCKSYEKLGSGASMNVFRGTYETSGITHSVAFKFVSASLNENTRERKRSKVLRDVKQEIRIMGRLKGHSRIVQLSGVSFDDHMPILILELAKGNLEDYLQAKQPVEWKIKLGFMYDIALGLEAIHQIKVVHGDLKGANILMYDGDNDQTVAKISDFGLSCTDFSVGEGRTPGYSVVFCSRECLDPEFKEWIGKHTTDIYSYGLVVYQIANDGKEPFEEYDEMENKYDLIDEMKKGGSDVTVLIEQLPNDTPIEVQKVIKMTVRNIPLERSSLGEVKGILKESTQLDQVYIYEDAKIAFESLAQIKPQETIDITAIMKLPIPLKLQKSIFLEYKRLTDAGDAISQNRLGMCWLFGFGAEQDINKAIQCFTNGAESGDTDAQFNLGLLYEFGLGVTKDHIKATELFLRAAEAGNVDAQYHLGTLYEDGKVVAKDYTKAIKWFTKASNAGNTMAQHYLGVCYANGYGVTRDYTKAIEWFTIAAEAGDADSQFNIGTCYEKGNGVPVNYGKAIEWYIKAAKAGQTSAQYNLGVFYSFGKGVTKSISNAVEWYKKAAEAGHADAQYNLGVCYDSGEGVVQDYVEAVEWYTKAAEAGNSDAQFNLGSCYKNGIGVAKDYTKAVEWYTRAANASNASAQCNLADLYEFGEGVPKDYDLAFALYTEAADAGIPYAKQALVRLSWKMKTCSIV